MSRSSLVRFPPLDSILAFACGQLVLMCKSVRRGAKMVATDNFSSTRFVARKGEAYEYKPPRPNASYKLVFGQISVQ